MLSFAQFPYAHCWCFKLKKGKRTITGPGQLLQDATNHNQVVKALGMAL